jgi:hypothetical protein
MAMVPAMGMVMGHVVMGRIVIIVVGFVTAMGMVIPTRTATMRRVSGIHMASISELGVLL